MRLKRFVFMADSFLKLFMFGSPYHRAARLLKNGLPDDAQIARIYDTFEGRIVIVVHSETFDEVLDGAIIPELPAPEFGIPGITE